jgi:2',3'-cyclic-nucleotide 2'-phosphodiesterase (5'-nucleotidase family)
MKPSARELARRDSILREQDKAETRARVTVATLRLPAEPGPGRGLGRLLADAYRNALRADVAIVRNDEVGAVLPAGQLTVTQIAEAAPESGRLLTLRLTGTELDEVLEHVVEARAPCCELAGLRVEFDQRATALERIRGVRLPNGKSLERKRWYVIALSPRLLDGDSVFTLGATSCSAGKGCRVAGRLDRWQVQRSDRTPADVLADYLRRLPQPVTPPDDIRLAPTR